MSDKYCRSTRQGNGAGHLKVCLMSGKQGDMLVQWLPLPLHSSRVAGMFPPTSQRWIGYSKLPIAVNECVSVCSWCHVMYWCTPGFMPVHTRYFSFTPSVPRIDSGSTASVTSIKWLLKMNEQRQMYKNAPKMLDRCTFHHNWSLCRKKKTLISVVRVKR